MGGRDRRGGVEGGGDRERDLKGKDYIIDLLIVFSSVSY